MSSLRDMQDESTLIALGRGSEKKFAKRIVVGSPHDETVKLYNATLNSVTPASEIWSEPIHSNSKILLQRHVAVGEEADIRNDSVISRQLRQAGDWTVLITTGRHNDATRAFQSKEIWTHIVKMIL